jgi:hypothetical protein
MAVQVTYTLVKIVSRINPNMVFDVSGGSMDDGAPLILYHDLGGVNQKFLLVDAGNGEKTIACIKSGKVLDVKDASPNNDTPIIQFFDHYGNNQLFRLVDLGNGFFKIVSKLDPNKVLDAQGGGEPTDGTQIILYQDHGSDNQQWRLDPL